MTVDRYPLFVLLNLIVIISVCVCVCVCVPGYECPGRIPERHTHLQSPESYNVSSSQGSGTTVAPESKRVKSVRAWTVN